MRRLTRIHTEYSDEIQEAVDRFGDHEGMNEARVLRWLGQFADDALPLAVSVIKAIRYYGTANIRAMTKQLFQIFGAELAEKDFKKAAFVAVDRGGSGSVTVVRALRQLVHGTGHRVMTMLEVAQMAPGAVDAIVFVDDFSGTGDTLVSWWDTVEPVVRPSNAAIFIGLLILREAARPRLEQFADVLAVTELDDSADVLSEAAGVFSEEQRATLIEYCRETGCARRYERGYGDCGLLIVLKHGCPNNSLPVLWVENDNWRSLFNRRAI